MRQILESQIINVTVYTDQALVTRRSVVSLTGQEQELAIAHLPVTLQPESVRVKGKGSMVVQILGVSTERTFFTEPVAPRVAQITQQIQQLEAQKRNLQAQIDALALQSSFIQGLREKTGEQFSVGLARKNLSLSEVLDFVNFLGSQYSEYAIATEDYKNQQREIEKQLQALRKQLQQVQTPEPQESINVLVEIQSAGAGELELEVSYVVNHASWHPLYDLRVDSQSQTVNLGYLAEIQQNTGEDWQDVNLTLSTAKPGLGTLPPQIQPWYIDIFRPSPPMMTRSIMPMAAPAASRGMDEAASLEAESLDMDGIVPITAAGVEVSKQGSVVTFKLAGGGNIPSDGSPHKKTIFHENYPCRFQYIAIPRLVSFAYLEAQVKNPGDGATLLPGNANIFRDQMFVGTTELANIAPGEDFSVNLGIDEGLKIVRNLVERVADKKLLGSYRKVTFAYRLSITNLLDQEATFKVTEQLPVSRNEQIKVRLLRSQPSIQLGEMGILEWVLVLPAQGKQELYYQFTVEYPPEIGIIGLDI
ncbi:mucoidy inhibitor MuiA family protein [Calothrix sp. 336/3]|uniref:mucoidy inhibitor MuiA family protein n=1 Tax=Calothrix sp. 336/3 TaxID=1337936 RepID=UPI0009E510C4|nr:mucoidy inhibitor MuiA family protein [Calothrix sp. 336/3]